MNQNIIYNEDCFETFRRIDDRSIDLILCDLPYGTTMCRWDTRIPLEPLWKEYKRIIKKNGAIVLTASQPFTSILVMSNLKWFRYEWIWSKNRGTGIFNAKKQPMKSHENILVFYNQQPLYNPLMREGKPYTAKQGKQSDGFGLNTSKDIITINQGNRYPLTVLAFNSTDGHNVHPTQKPVALFEYLIKTYTNEGDLVLDNCLGSGTTVIACLNTNRNYIGCELDKGYYDIAVKRIEEAKSIRRLI